MRYALTLGGLHPGEEFVIKCSTLRDYRHRSVDLDVTLLAPPRLVELVDRLNVAELRGTITEHRSGSTFVTFPDYGATSTFELGSTFPCRRPRGGLLGQGRRS